MGVSRYMVVRMLDSFFRRWWLYLIPVVLLVGLGASKVAAAKSTYVASGTVNVASSTLLSTLSDVRGNPSYGYDTPATATGKQLNALVQTDQFVRDVAATAGLNGQLSSGLITLDQVRAAVTSFAAGPNVLKVSATYADPATAQKLATATINRYIEMVLGSEVSDSTAAQSFYSQLAAKYKSEVTTARQRLEDYFAAHPSTPGKPRPDQEISDLSNLNSNATQAENRYNQAVGKSEDAQSSIQQVKSDINQRLRIVDAPQAGIKQAQLKKSLLSFGMFFLIGLLLTLGMVVIATVLDRSVRNAVDVRDRLGLRLLATIPDVGSSLAARPKKAKAPETASEPAVDTGEALATARGPLGLTLATEGAAEAVSVGTATEPSTGRSRATRAIVARRTGSGKPTS